MNVLALGLDRTRLELREYRREKEAVFFNFLFPILMLWLFATIFGDQFEDQSYRAIGLNAGRVFLPGMLAAGVLLTSFQTMAMSVAVERDDGTLKRVRSTPLPPIAYFMGKIGLVAVTSVFQVGALLVMARFAFDVPLPTDLRRWSIFAAVLVLGLVSGVALGIAYSSLASARSAATLVIAPVLILQFISGVYFPFKEIPAWLQQISAIFPLKWIAQGMRSVFLPEQLATDEMAQAWEPGLTLLVLGVWSLIGIVLCVTTFRWFKRGTT